MLAVLAVAFCGGIAWLFTVRVPWSQPSRGALTPAASVADSESRNLDALGDSRAAERTDSRPDGRASVAARTIIEVVDRADGSPVADAEVLVPRRDIRAGDLEAESERCSSRETALRRGLGTVLTTDAFGRVEIAAVDVATLVLASLGHRHGRAEISANDRLVRIELDPKHCLEIDVVDRAGTPAAGVAVALMSRDALAWSSDWRARTDEHGRLAIHAIEDLVEFPDSQLAVGTSLVRCAPEQLTFALAKMPTSPQRLVVEPTGSIELAIVSADGRPIAFDAEFSLRIDDDRCTGLPPVMETSGWHDASVGTGTARFDGIGLGLPFEASGFVVGAAKEWKHFDGPKMAGEIVSVALPIGQIKTRVRGRLAEADGRPVAERSMEARVLTSRPPPKLSEPRWFEATTREDGTFEASGIAESEGCVTLTARLIVDRDDGTKSMVDLTIPEPTLDSSPLRRPCVELGEVVLPAVPLLPLIASGRVDDEHGAPVSGASIEIRVAGSELWSHLEATTRADGTFTLRSEFPIDRFDIRARRWRGASEPTLDVSSGTQGLTLRLIESGSVFVRVLTPEGFDDVDFAMRRAGDDGFRLRSYENGDDGTHRMYVPPGTYELDVDLEGRIVAQRTAIDVRPGQETDLGVIDLRETFHAFRVTVVDESGMPLGQADVAAFEDGQLVAQTETDEEGVAVIPSRTTQLDIAAGARDCRARMLRGVQDGARIALEPGIPVTLRIPAPFTEPKGANVSLQLEYVGGDPRGAARPWTWVELDENGRVDELLPLAGVYEVHVLLSRRDPYLRLPVALPSPLRIAVDEAGASIELPVSDASLHAALERGPK